MATDIAKTAEQRRPLFADTVFSCLQYAAIGQLNLQRRLKHGICREARTITLNKKN